MISGLKHFVFEFQKSLKKTSVIKCEHFSERIMVKRFMGIDSVRQREREIEISRMTKVCFCVECANTEKHPVQQFSNIQIFFWFR